MVNTVKIAIPTKSDKGLKDHISNVFGKSKTFTILDIQNGSIAKVEVLKNPAAKYKHGAGPIVVKTLVDMNVNAAASREFGVGSSTLLQMYNIRKIKIKPNISVDEALQDILKQLNEKEVN